MTIGDKIKQYRKEKGLTQEDLGNLVGLSGVAIMRYEKGQREPKQDILIRISKALDIHLRDLVENIWAEFDSQNPDLSKNIVQDISFESYIKFLGFTIKYNEGDINDSYEQDEYDDNGNTIGHSKVIEDCEYNVSLTKDGKTATFSPEEFDELKVVAKEAIEDKFYRKLWEQQNK